MKQTENRSTKPPLFLQNKHTKYLPFFEEPSERQRFYKKQVSILQRNCDLFFSCEGVYFVHEEALVLMLATAEWSRLASNKRNPCNNKIRFVGLLYYYVFAIVQSISYRVPHPISVRNRLWNRFLTASSRGEAFGTARREKHGCHITGEKHGIMQI